MFRCLQAIYDFYTIEDAFASVFRRSRAEDMELFH